MTVLRIVDVETGDEVSSAHLVDGVLRYDGGESARGVVEQLMRVAGLSAAQAIDHLLRDGWSNGYLKVARDR